MTRAGPDFHRESPRKRVSALVTDNDVFAPVAVYGDVIERVGEFDADGAGHGGKNSIGDATMLDLTPFRLTPFRF